MPKHHSPSTIAPPLSRYSHAVETPASARWLHISGQVGIKPDGSLADGLRDRTLGPAKPASTLIIVAGLARPEYRIEIEAIATAD